MTPVDVVGLGAATVDYLGLVPHFPEPDDKMAMRELVRQGGGLAATALVALARLGATTRYVSVPVKDTTGAGECAGAPPVFHGAFLYALLQDRNLRRCVTFAAALKCRALGGRAGIPTFSEALAFLGWD